MSPLSPLYHFACELKTIKSHWKLNISATNDFSHWKWFKCWWKILDYEDDDNGNDSDNENQLNDNGDDHENSDCAEGDDGEEAGRDENHSESVESHSELL